MIAFLLAAQIVATAVPCTTPQPAPTAGLTWVCAGGGWIPQAAPAPPPPPVDTAPFRLGRRYTRVINDALVTIHVAGSGQLADGASVVFAQVCLYLSDLAPCSVGGPLLLFPTNAPHTGWTELPVAPETAPTLSPTP